LGSPQPADTGGWMRRIDIARSAMVDVKEALRLWMACVGQTTVGTPRGDVASAWRRNARKLNDHRHDPSSCRSLPPERSTPTRRA